MIDNTQIKELFKKYAAECGISEIGIVSLTPTLLNKQFERFSEWLDKRYHAEMSWMNKYSDKRQNPARLLGEEYGSAIVCLFSYNTGRYYNTENHNRSGKIAQYAWGRDYHDIIPKQLKILIRKIEEATKTVIKSRVYTDTGPILERDLAVLAGVGWRGKNSLILNKKLGSYTFIGTIITDLELDSDKPVLDRCGTCNLCISNCPTNAIVQPYVVDSNKCISYLTIEKPLPDVEDDRNREGWLYGCDICQQVCPYNNIRNPLSPIEGFHQLNFGKAIDPIVMLDMDTEEFNKKKIKSPIKRAGLEGLKRNAKYLMKQHEQ